MTRPIALLLFSIAFSVPAGSNQSGTFTPPIVKPPPRRLSLYEAATWGTVVPASLLRAIAIVESDEYDTAVGDDGRSLGRFQINEAFRETRVRLFGAYDPHDPVQSARVAVGILAAHYARFKDWTLAISAYNQGAEKTAKVGPRWIYVRKVKAALRKVGA